MPAAVAVPAIIGGGASLGGAFMQSRASKNAAKTQERAGQQALNLQRQIYNDQRQMMSPYLQAGQGAMNLLGRLVAPSAGMTFAAPPMQQAPMPGPEPGALARMRNGEMPSLGMAVPRNQPRLY